MNAAELKAEILANPDCAEALAAKDCEEVRRIASIGRSKIVGISRSIFSMWCAKTGMRAAIEDHSLAVDSPLRSVALTLKDFLVGPPNGIIDFSDPDNLASLDAWKAFDNLTEDQAKNLIELGRIEWPYTFDEIANAVFNESE